MERDFSGVYWEVGMKTDLKFEDEFGNASFVGLH